jgi:hypothetical protein
VIGKTICFLLSPITHHPSLITYQGFDIFNRATERGPVSAFDYWALNQIRVLEHQRDKLIIGELSFPQAQLFVDGFARPQDIARRELHFSEQPAQTFFVERRCIVIDFLYG